jgi:hypothetical protein
MQQDTDARVQRLEAFRAKQAADRKRRVSSTPSIIKVLSGACCVLHGSLNSLFLSYCCPVLQLEAKAERLKREELRAEVLDVAREERRALLLRRSSNWITPQTLDARIKEALDNPVPLHAD